MIAAAITGPVVPTRSRAPLAILIPLAIIVALGLIGIGVVLGQMLTREGPAACPWVAR